MDIKESIKKIIDKKFESVINGYSPSAVDLFLDSIVTELEVLDNKHEEYKEQIEKIKNELDEAKKRIHDLERQREKEEFAKKEAQEKEELARKEIHENETMMIEEFDDGKL